MGAFVKCVFFWTESGVVVSTVKHGGGPGVRVRPDQAGKPFILPLELAVSLL